MVEQSHMEISPSHKQITEGKTIYSWWFKLFKPIWKNISKMGSSLQIKGKSKTCMKPPPRYPIPQKLPKIPFLLHAPASIPHGEDFLKLRHLVRCNDWF